MFLHHEHHPSAWLETRVPRHKELVQRTLADSDGWVRPHLVDDEVARELVGEQRSRVRVRPQVLAGQLDRSAIDVDRPHLGRRCPVSERDGDRAVPAAEIDQPGRRRSEGRPIDQQQPGSDVEPVMSEHASVGDQLGGQVGEHQRHRGAGRGNIWFASEVLATGGRGVGGIGGHRADASLEAMSSHAIRIFGDPVLRTPADVVTELDGRLARLADDMFDTMYDANGLGLAAPQIGVRKRFFVYDHGDGPEVLVNPVLEEGDGEWVYEEGCLSVPGLSWEITRPKTVHVVGFDLDGNEVSIEADELVARLFQHELDHLNGVLLVDHLDDEQRRDAMRVIREMGMGRSQKPSSTAGGLSLP